jgi:hypothetical protein
MTKNGGYYFAIATTILAIITFGIAILTPPKSGPGCSQNCYTYPYNNVVERFPRDFYWIYPAILLSISYLGLVTYLKISATDDKKIFGEMGHSLALMAASILLINYWVQISTVPPSLIKGEFGGISLISQFNSHGVFIALEELGFGIMSTSFLFLAFIFSDNKLGRWIKAIFLTNFGLTTSALAIISTIYGVEKEYWFEMAVIPINWLTLIISGVLLSRYFGNK